MGVTGVCLVAIVGIVAWNRGTPELGERIYLQVTHSWTEGYKRFTGATLVCWWWWCFAVLNLFLCMDVLTACISICAPRVCLMLTETRRSHQIFLELELQMVVSHRVDAENQASVLLKTGRALNH